MVDANADVRADLLTVLARVPDPRDPRGVRFPLVGMLAVAVSAVLAGAKSFAAIGEFAADLDTVQLGRLGLGKAPVESTLRKLFARLDAAAQTHRWGQFKPSQWGQIRLPNSERTAPHLIAALDHATGVVLGQNQVEAKSNEIPAVRDLLTGFDPCDLRGCVITVDAMHTQDDTAATILDAGADYVFTVKANRPTLLSALKKLPWNKVPVGSRTTQLGHGRRATRTIKVIDLPMLPDWPEFVGCRPGRATTQDRHQEREEVRGGGLPHHLRQPSRRTTGHPGRVGAGPLGNREPRPLGA
ncbi:ISAs1 family transposase [Nostocoides sp.]